MSFALQNSTSSQPVVPVMTKELLTRSMEPAQAANDDFVPARPTALEQRRRRQNRRANSW